MRGHQLTYRTESSPDQALRDTARRFGRCLCITRNHIVPGFDRALIKAMVPHHETAVAAAKVIGTSTERSELKQVAEDMIESPQGEIDQMQGWLAVWYPG